MCALDTISATAGAAPAGPCAALMPDEHAAFIREILDRVGDKWTLMVIATLQNGERRYSDLHQAIPGISQRMLTLTLRQLVQDGLATRTSYPEVPPRVEYALTPLGTSLLDVAGPLLKWASAHHEKIREHRARSGPTTPVKR
jgi:DNA-binding HxlR family transcriptional regulator